MPITTKEVTKRVRLSDIDDRWSKLTAPEKSAAKVEIGNFLVDKINQFLDQSSSPVSGGSFKVKLKKGGSSRLFDKGDMRAAITFAEFRDGVDVGVFNDKQAAKAHGHNTGGGHLPVRQIIPDDKQKFKQTINTGMRSIISQLLGDRDVVEELLEK